MNCPLAQQIACIILHAPRNITYIDGWCDIYEYLDPKGESSISGYWLDYQSNTKEGNKSLLITGQLKNEKSRSTVKCSWVKQYEANIGEYIQGEKYSFNPKITIEGKIDHQLLISKDLENYTLFSCKARIGAWQRVRGQSNWITIESIDYTIYEKTVRESDLNTVVGPDGGEGIPIPFQNSHVFMAYEKFTDSISYREYTPDFSFEIPIMPEEDRLRLTTRVTMEFTVNGSGHISTGNVGNDGLLITRIPGTQTIHMTLDENSDCYSVLNQG